MKPISKIVNWRRTILSFIIVIVVSCDFSSIEDGLDIRVVNNLFLDQQEVNLTAARLQITGPVNITGPNSHFSALVEISSDESFSNELPLNGNRLILEILVANDNIQVSGFPIPNGNYQILDFQLLESKEIADAVEGKDIMVFPLFYFQHLGEEEFQAVFEGQSGLINMQFDIQNDLIRLSHNWETKEGQKITGFNTLPLNLSSFRN